jgi:hypothetical protein
MGTQGQDGLPEFDHHLDHSDVLVLRRQDGSFVAAFDAREVAMEEIVAVAKEDHARSVQARASDPSRLPEDNARKGRSARDEAERSRLGAASKTADAGDDRACGDRREAAGDAPRERGSVARPPRPPAEGDEEETDGRPTGRDGSELTSPPRERQEHIPKKRHGQVRWYNPELDDFEWREVPHTDERALEWLEGSPNSPACAHTYREWRELGASIKAALIRAGEVAQAEREREKADAAEARWGRA